MKRPAEPKCCSLPTLSLAIGTTFLLLQLGLLIVTCFVIVHPDDYVAQITHWLIDRTAGAPTSSSKEYAARKLGDFLAIPVTVNVVLVISDGLLVWATLVRSQLLLWPWIILHGIEFVLLVASLIVFMIVAREPWIKVMAFLVSSPFIVLLGFFCFVVKRFNDHLRDLNVKTAAADFHVNSPSPQPLTVYTPEPYLWDQPLPVWAVRSVGGLAEVPSKTGQRSSPPPPPNEKFVDFVDDRVDDDEPESSQSNKFRKSKCQFHTAMPLAPGDRTSIVSLSDRFRTTEEVEIYQEHFHYNPPPQPVRPS